MATPARRRSTPAPTPPSSRLAAGWASVEPPTRTIRVTAPGSISRVCGRPPAAADSSGLRAARPAATRSPARRCRIAAGSRAAATRASLPAMPSARSTVPAGGHRLPAAPTPGHPERLAQQGPLPTGGPGTRARPPTPVRPLPCLPVCEPSIACPWSDQSLGLSGRASSSFKRALMLASSCSVVVPASRTVLRHFDCSALSAALSLARLSAAS